MIRNQVQLSDDISLVSQRLDGLETQIQTLINGQQLIIRTINQTRKKDKRRTVRKPPEQKLLGQKSKQPPEIDVSRLLHLPEALQRNIRRFTETILFRSSDIPDDLISMECLSEDESSTISLKPSQKDQTRLLIKKIKTRGPEVIEKFLNIVRKDHPELVTEVYKSLEEIVNKYKDKPACAICVMQLTVDLKDIADYLWEQKIISDDIYGDIIVSESLHRSRPLIWSSIMNALNNLTDTGEAKSILINALTPKYEYIVEYINQNPDRPSLSCFCCTKSRRVRPRTLVSEYGSQTDVSTTSAKLPKFLDDDNVSEDSQSVISSQGLPSSNLLSYELPERFESIGNNSFPQSEIQSKVIDSTTTLTGESTAENICPRLTSECIVQQGEHGEINEAQHTCTQYDTSTYLGEFSNDITEAETKKKQELKHSISTVSDASTVCAVHSLSSIGAVDDTVPTDEVQILFQTDPEDNGKDTVFHVTIEANEDQDTGTVEVDEDEITGKVAGNHSKEVTDKDEDTGKVAANDAKEVTDENEVTGKVATNDAEEVTDEDTGKVGGNDAEEVTDEDTGKVGGKDAEEVTDEDEDTGKVTGNNAEEVTGEDEDTGKVTAKDAAEVADEDEDTGKVAANDAEEVTDEDEDTGKVAGNEAEEVTDEDEDTGKVTAKDAEEVADEDEDTGKVAGNDAKEVTDEDVDTVKVAGNDAEEVTGEDEDTGKVTANDAEEVTDEDEDTGKVAANDAEEVTDKDVDTEKVAGNDAEEVTDEDEDTGKVTGNDAEEVIDKDEDTGKVAGNDAEEVNDKKEEIQVSSTTVDHDGLQQRKPLGRLTNIPNEVEETVNTDDVDQVSSTT